MARVAIGGFQHETNCFVEGRTDFAYFTAHRDRPPLVRDQAVIEWLSGTTFALAGFLDAVRHRHEAVPLLWTSGGAGALVSRDAFERIAAEMVAALSHALPVDAVYLDLHGACVTEDFEDGEGELLRRIRAAVGEDIPIVISLDYHANVTRQMVEMADGLVGYLTYPHIDRVQTGRRAAAVLDRVLAEGRPPGRALRRLPFLIPLNDQCTMVEPSATIVSQCRECDTDIVSLAWLAGFPPSDLAECGPAVIAYARSQAAADAAADRLHEDVMRREREFAVPMVSPEEGVQRAMAIAVSASKPVVLADTQDNPGCGGTADTTGLLKALLSSGAQGAALGYLCDPAAAASAHAAGEGATISIALGGHHGPSDVSPLTGPVIVERLGTGQFRTTGAVSGDRPVDLGPMALLRIDGVRVAVTSKRMQAHDAAPFQHLGIDPTAQRILVLKSTCHFRAVFEPMAEEVIVVLAPGGYLADPAAYGYRRLRKGVRLRPLGPTWPGTAE